MGFWVFCTWVFSIIPKLMAFILVHISIFIKRCYNLQARDSGNNFCRFLFLGYPKRNNFIPSRSQKKQPETTRHDQKRSETKLFGKIILCNKNNCITNKNFTCWKLSEHIWSPEQRVRTTTIPQIWQLKKQNLWGKSAGITMNWNLCHRRLDFVF